MGLTTPGLISSPIHHQLLQDYMNKKKIRMVVDKKSLLLADENLNITKDIMSLLNKKLKSVSLE